MEYSVIDHYTLRYVEFCNISMRTVSTSDTKAGEKEKGILTREEKNTGPLSRIMTTLLARGWDLNDPKCGQSTSKAQMFVF